MADSDDDLSPRYPSLASILTNKQREYLLGQSDIEERTRSERAIPDVFGIVWQLLSRICGYCRAIWKSAIV